MDDHEIQERLQALFEKQVEDMDECGITLMAVAAAPGFTYSIGLYRLNHPEIVVFGLNPTTAHALITNVYDRVKEGESFSDGDRTDKIIQGFPVVFRKIRNEVATSEYAVWAAHHAKDEGFGIPDVLALVWPDEDGRFIWDEGFNEKFVPVQPIVWDSTH